MFLHLINIFIFTMKDVVSHPLPSSSIRSHRDNSITSRRVQRKNNNSSQLYKQLEKPQKQKSKTKPRENFKYTPIKTPIQNGDKVLSPMTDVNQQLINNCTKNTRKIHDKSISNKSVSRKKISHKDSSQYYRFWKNKANEYQTINFNLQRLNSALQQQLQILKHHNQKLLKKLKKEGSPHEHNEDPLDKQKLEKFYKHKIEALNSKILDQQRTIKRQDQKLKQLSQYLSENHQLKNLLQNMEDRVSEIQSIEADRRSFSSRKQSIRQIPILSSGNMRNNQYQNLLSPRSHRQMGPETVSSNNILNRQDLSVFNEGKPRILIKSRSNCNLDDERLNKNRTQF